MFLSRENVLYNANHKKFEKRPSKNKNKNINIFEIVKQNEMADI
jgi:hypothetical protein